jgi:hypothetical protein
VTQGLFINLKRLFKPTDIDTDYRAVKLLFEVLNWTQFVKDAIALQK